MTSLEQSLPQTHAISGGAVKGLKDLARLRLVTGSILLLVSLVGVLGADWDIQWHAVVGRDQTFTPPHDLILLGIGLSGIVALVSILIETTWSGRHPDLRAYGADFLGLLHSSLGLYLVGFGAVCSAVAFPLDTYWHALYGIDVSLWAPFHTMIYTGSVLSTFGVISLLFEAAHLAERQHARRTALFSYIGLVATLGILLSKFSTFLTPALSGHTLRLGAITLTFFPFLLALVAVFVCVLAVRLVPWMGAATLVVAGFLLILLLVSTFVPPMMTLLVQVEHETYLARASRIGSTIVPLSGQTPALLLLALCLDGVVWLGRRGTVAPSRQTTWMLVAALASMVLVAGFTLVLAGVRAQAAPGGGGGRAGHLLLGFVLALLLTIPGSLLGHWLAQTMSRTLTMNQMLHTKRR
ncbi:MAG TPA: hypothetical protein VKT82_25140 [Ktedonobacterales bacterium]|nr:hypothetical protein [Ktedonobacterales bacterium]